MIQSLLAIGLLASTLSPFASMSAKQEQPTVLATHTISLEKRAYNSYVNDVFKKNMLRAVYLMNGDTPEMVTKNETYSSDSFHKEIALKSHETFSFHENVLPEFSGKIAKTSNSHFSGDQGFLSDGYLMGNGVCHLASLMYWVAKDAGLTALAPTNHDFAAIPEIDPIYGVAIYYMPDGGRGSASQNLYITNNLEETIYFVFDFNGKDLTFSVTK